MLKNLKFPLSKNITHLLEVARKTSRLVQLTGDDMLDFLLAYNKGLKILDDYDHQTMESNTGNESTYILNYDECIDVINRTTYTDKGDLFGLEKNDSFKSQLLQFIKVLMELIFIRHWKTRQQIYCIL